MLKERRNMLAADRTTKVRVVDKNFVPVIQEKKAGATSWSTVKFEQREDNSDRRAPGRPRRSERRNTVQLDDEEGH
jgi:hypothetical protein